MPRRVPSDYADIVVYEDDECRRPWLVVENKEEECTAAGRRQGIEQGFGNANSLRAPYMLFDCGRESDFFDVANFAQEERTRNRLGTRDAAPEHYNQPSRFPLVASGAEDIVAVPAAELERRVRRAHGLIWAGGKRDPLQAFDQWSKLLFAKIYDEGRTPTGRPRRFQCGVGETTIQVANRVRHLYSEARQHDPSIFSDPHIRLPDNKVRDVVEAVQKIGLSLMPIDALGHAFEHFFSSIFRGDIGQYFPRRELARFMVGVVRPTDRDFIIDPTCGSGGFLLEVLLQVWHSIDAQYAGQPDVGRRKYDFAHQNLFGVEIHDVLGRVCQTNLLLHKDGHTNVETDRSCLDASFEKARIRANGTVFTVAVGNPPFGSKIKASDTDALGDNTLDDFEMGGGAQAKSELLVLERSFEFLQPGGRLAMVIPDGILNNPGEGSRCPTFRRYLLRTARIDAIVSLPDFAFRKSGAQNKTSILFATKYTEEEKEEFDAEYEEELGRLRAVPVEVQDDAGEGATGEAEGGESEDDGDVAVVSLSARAEAVREARAIAAVLARYDYPVFLAEAEEIGYTPAGADTDANDLYALSGGFPDRSAANTILGQYEVYEGNRSAYQGSSAPACMSIQAAALFAAHPTYRMDPKFHLFERERFHAPPPGMRLVTLGTVLQPRGESVVPTERPDEEFLVPTLTQEGRLTPREAGQGVNPPAWFGQYFTGGSRWKRIRQGDLMFSQIDLWKGSVAIVPAEYDGAIVTQEFPVYTVDTSQLDPHYLRLVLRSRYFQRAIRAITTGHSNRRRTQVTDFENLTIFVPTDVGVQSRVSEVVQQRERATSRAQADYHAILEAVDRLITGEIRPEDMLGA